VREQIASHETVKMVGDNFILTNVENTGAALNLGQDLSPNMKMIFLQILPLFILALLFVYVLKESKISRLHLVAISFIIGGGLGNIYDRILYDSVTDFMYLEYGFLHTGIFNMADVSVVIGGVLILINPIVEAIQNIQIRKVNL